MSTLPHLAAGLRIDRLDPGKPQDAADLVRLLDAYARDPAGGGTPLSAEVQARLPAVLKARPHYAGWLAREEGVAIGLVNAFEGVSTFKAQPLLNVHDIVVDAAYRGRGVGRALLAAVEAEARGRGCCKLTLEALEGNLGAIALYQRFGFEAYALDPALGQAVFFEKWLH